MPSVTVSRSERVADLVSEIVAHLNDHGVPDESWRAEGACLGVNPELFFPRQGEPAAAAIAVCAGCPVRVACLTWAVCHGEKTGIWGGAAERTRRCVRRVLNRMPQAVAA